MVSNDYFLFFFVIFFCRADTQIRRYADRCSRLLAIDACLLSKIVFLLSRMSTKIDFCGATGHDHGGWQVAAADGDGTKTKDDDHADDGGNFFFHR